jgi:hypothetical protein
VTVFVGRYGRGVLGSHGIDALVDLGEEDVVTLSFYYVPKREAFRVARNRVDLGKAPVVIRVRWRGENSPLGIAVNVGTQRP